MGLYNHLFGVNPASGILLALIGQNAATVGRFRDAYVTELDGETVIAIYTRNGGGNREHWDDERDEGPDCDCTGCTITYRIPQMPGYVRDQDDDFDCTYCTIYFRPANDEYRDLLAGLVQEGTPDQDWLDLIAALENPPAKPDTRGAKIAAKLVASIEAREA